LRLVPKELVVEVNNLPMYVERALEGRCVICRRKLRTTAIKLYNAAAVSWDREHGEVDGDIEVKVCGDTCLGLFNAGENPS
jgi:hypothetical protein